MSPVLVPLDQAGLPFSVGSLYTLRRRHGWLWMTKVGPDGHTGRILWVDLPAAAQWFSARGRTALAESLAAKAVQIEQGRKGGQ
ncbi:hypothetical protein [Roseateles sp. DB2]|uniref:hypothetical protein n=1 Tax=Roseateles sp. DB2 TaxID=3453717 RepID=UPI003F716530